MYSNIDYSIQQRPLTSDALLQVRKIFFSSANQQVFKDEDQKYMFFKTWMDYYVNKNTNTCLFTAKFKDEVIGYLAGCYDSTKAIKYFSKKINHYETFQAHFSEFPAHLHINLHENSRGHGVGSRLIELFIQHLQEKNLQGVHLVTAVKARNISFYQRNYFHDEFTSGNLIFLGQKI